VHAHLFSTGGIYCITCAIYGLEEKRGYCVGIAWAHGASSAWAGISPLKSKVGKRRRAHCNAKHSNGNAHQDMHEDISHEAFAQLTLNELWTPQTAEQMLAVLSFVLA